MDLFYIGEKCLLLYVATMFRMMATSSIGKLLKHALIS